MSAYSGPILAKPTSKGLGVRAHYISDAVCYTNALTHPCDSYTHVRVTCTTQPRSHIIGKSNLQEEASENRRRQEKAREGQRRQEAGGGSRRQEEAGGRRQEQAGRGLEEAG